MSKVDLGKMLRAKTPMCEKRGSVVFTGGRVHLFDREVSLPYFSASWPLAKLHCYPDSVVVKVGPLVIFVSRADIDEVRFRKMTFWSVLMGDTLTIRHHGRAPNPVVFGSHRGLEPIARVFEEMGIRVADG